MKTGFVCASGYNISATAKRGNTRIVAVVMGARSPGVRSTETAKLLNGTYHELAMAHPEKAHEFEAVYSGSCTVQQESNLKARAQDGHRTRKGLRIGKPKIRLSHGKSKIAGNTKSLGEEKPAKAIDRMASKRPSGESKATKSNHAAETSKHTHVRASSEAKTKPVAGVGGRVAKTRAERAGASEKGAAVRKASHEHGSREAKSASKDQEVEKGKSQQKKKKHSVSST